MARVAPYTVPLLAALALAGQGCRTHDQSEGSYAFTVTSVEKDDCQFVPASGVLPGGTFTSSGNMVSIDYEWYGMTLAGAYYARPFGDTSPERFYADGSAQNVAATVGDVQCTLDLATVHVSATTDSPERFQGTLRFRYEARQPAECLCETWVSFQAVHQ